ncbi:MAG: hypothetical protein ACD_75C01808G0007 [uncultured bacterium]|nr:MAG: hypothetical protein ACD_75C01808G0007 [uncultured bacterium]
MKEIGAMPSLPAENPPYPAVAFAVQDDGLIDYIRQVSNLFLSFFFYQAVQYFKSSMSRDTKYTISTFYTKP